MLDRFDIDSLQVISAVDCVWVALPGSIEDENAFRAFIGPDDLSFREYDMPAELRASIIELTQHESVQRLANEMGLIENDAPNAENAAPNAEIGTRMAQI